MEMQLLFNIAVGLAGALASWVLKSITDTMKDMRQSEHSLRNKLQAIEVVMAGKYVSKEDLNSVANTLSVKLDRISDKLDTKQDKIHL